MPFVTQDTNLRDRYNRTDSTSFISNTDKNTYSPEEGLIGQDPFTNEFPSSEYDPNFDSRDKKHVVGTGPNLRRKGAGEASRLDLVGEKPVSTDANGRVVQHYYEPEGPTYLDEFESRTGTFQGYE